MKRTTPFNPIKNKIHFKVYINTFFFFFLWCPKLDGYKKKLHTNWLITNINIIFICRCWMTIILYYIVWHFQMIYVLYSGGICERQVQQVTCQTENRLNSNLIPCSFRFWVLVSILSADEQVRRVCAGAVVYIVFR